MANGIVIRREASVRENIARRKPIYERLALLVRAGLTPAAAIKRIDYVCPNVALLQIAQRLRQAEREGSLHPSLMV